MEQSSVIQQYPSEPDEIEFQFLNSNIGENFYSVVLFFYDDSIYEAAARGEKIDTVSYREIKAYHIAVQNLSLGTYNVQSISDDFTRKNIHLVKIDQDDVEEEVFNHISNYYKATGIELSEDEISAVQDNVTKFRVKSAILSLLGRCHITTARYLLAKWQSVSNEITASMKADDDEILVQ
jgi:hypothetical protein